MRIISQLVGMLAAVLAFALAPAAFAQATTAPAATSAQAPVPAQAATRAPAPTTTAALPPAATTQEAYVIGAGDVLDVVLVGPDDYRARVTVQTDGTIQLPFLNSIEARGKTLLALGREIAAKLEAGGYYVKPAIQVTVAQISSSYITVLGAVGNPGLVPIDREYRVSEIMARVGGIRPGGAETFYLRRASGEELPLTIATIARGGPDADPLVRAGDKLFVPDAPTFYIYGQVNAPGTYPIMGKMTLRMALARGGGLTSLGSDRRITVVRGGQELTRVDLSQPVQEDDVIVVGERFF